MIILLFFLFLNSFEDTSSDTIYLFAPSNCSKCKRLYNQLNLIEKINQNHKIYLVDPYQDSGRQIYIDKFNSMNFPNKNEYYLLPALYIGDTVLYGFDISDSLVISILNKDKIFLSSNNNNYSKLSINAMISIIILGLTDGVNPCAIAVLLFLLSFLSLRVKKKNKIIMSAIFFIFGIFIFYIFFGWGIIKLLDKYLVYMPIVSKSLKIFIALFCITAAIFQIIDIKMKRREKYSSLSFKTQNWIHKFLNLNKNILFPFYFFIGIILSFSELLCTGQIYFPTLIMIHSIKFNSIIYLMIYNILFILPLLVIVMIYFILRKSESKFKKLSLFFKEKENYFRLLISMILISLAIYLIFNIFQ